MYRASGVEPPASPVAAAHSAEPGGAELPMTSRGPAPADINPISGASGQADLGVDVPLTDEQTRRHHGRETATSQGEEKAKRPGQYGCAARDSNPEPAD